MSTIPYPSVDEATIIRTVEARMEDAMAKYDPSHDAYHVRRVRKMALQIARTVSSSASKQPDLLVIEIAALLHDVLDKKYASPEALIDPYNTYFVPFFQALALEVPSIDLVKDGRAKKITMIVENVSWSTEVKLRKEGKWGAWHDECLELHCVQDADRLDAIGAFGIMRVSAYSAAVNQVLHASNGDPIQPKTAIQHFHDKLLRIRERMKTVPGKEMAEKRHQVMLDFLEAVDSEYEGKQ